MRPREKIVEAENVPREISYKLGHSRVGLDLPFNQEIHKFKNVKFEIFNFLTFSATLFANTSRSMGPSGKIVAINNVPRKISYQKGHSRVSLDIPFNLEIKKCSNVKF